REVVPETEQGRVQLHLTMSSDSDLPLVSVRSEAIERHAAARPEVQHVLADLGERDEARLELEPRPPYEADITLIMKQGVASRPVATALLEDLEPVRANDLAIEVRPVQTQLEALLTRGEGDLFIDLVS